MLFRSEEFVVPLSQELIKLPSTQGLDLIGSLERQQVRLSLRWSQLELSRTLYQVG